MENVFGELTLIFAGLGTAVQIDNQPKIETKGHSLHCYGSILDPVDRFMLLVLQDVSLLLTIVLKLMGHGPWWHVMSLCKGQQPKMPL